MTWGHVTTWPIVFKGTKLALNVNAKRILDPATQDYGVRVEITDPMNQVLPGYSYRDCDPIREDNVRCPVTWKGNPDVGHLAGKPIKLRFYMSFASLYAFQFQS